MRHQQPSLWETFFATEVAELWEPWMRAVDELLEDDELLGAVFEAQGQRHGMSRAGAQLLDRVEGGGMGGCHLFRHTGATLVLDNGVDIPVIQEMLGHVRLTTTVLYTRVDLDEQKRPLETPRLPDWARPKTQHASALAGATTRSSGVSGPGLTVGMARAGMAPAVFTGMSCSRR